MSFFFSHSRDFSISAIFFHTGRAILWAGRLQLLAGSLLCLPFWEMKNVAFDITLLAADDPLVAVGKLHQALQHALQEQDWEAVVGLDEALNQQVRRALAQGGDEAERQSLAALLQELQRVYGELLEQGERHRDDLARQLQQVRRNSSAANQYLASGQQRR